jgi:hypothetical protein
VRSLIAVFERQQVPAVLGEERRTERHLADASLDRDQAPVVAGDGGHLADVGALLLGDGTK